MGSWFNFIFSESKEGKLRKALLSPLCLLSFFYGVLVRVRVSFYRAGLFRSASLPCKVISVGNITLGGTGKTPFVILLAELFRARQIPVAILSRGYKGSFSGPSGMVSDGLKILMDGSQAGDEPCLLAGRLPGVPVFIGRERLLSGRAAVERFRVQAVILDDGFQHLPLRRDLNLLLLDARRPFGNGCLLPRGELREPSNQARRADAIILTKVDLADNILKLKDHLRREAPGCPVFAVRYVPVGIRDPFEGRTLPPEVLHGKKILGFAGIGSPASFRGSLENLGAEIVQFDCFRDHYSYRPEDFRKLLQDAGQRGAEVLVTTEKDAVRLGEFPRGEIPLWVLLIRHEFVAKEQEPFEAFLWSRLGLEKKE